MKNIIYKIISKRKSAVVKNFFSLSSFQLISYALPLLTVPYVVRVIGPEKYGVINFATAFITYFTLIVNYGFGLSATREISHHRNEKDKVQQIFNSVFFAQTNLFILCTIVFIILIFSVSQIKSEQLLFIFVYLGLLGTLFFPTWFYQGIEKLSKIVVFNFISRLLFTISIFIFIKQESDYLIIPLLTSIGQIFAAVLSFIYALKHFDIRIKYPGIKKVISELKNAWIMFSSTVVINFYTTSNIVILGFFASSINVGFYSGAMKLMSVVQGLLTMPLNQSLYPHIGNSFSIGYETGIIKLKKATVIVGILTFFLSLLLFLFAPLLVKIILGKSFLPSILTLRILSFIPFIVGLSNVFGIQGLLNLKKDKIFFKVTFIGAIINIALNFILTPIIFQNGTAIAWLITEIFITAAFFVILLKQNINLFDIKALKISLKGTN